MPHQHFSIILYHFMGSSSSIVSIISFISSSVKPSLPTTTAKFFTGINPSTLSYSLQRSKIVSVKSSSQRSAFTFVKSSGRCALAGAKRSIPSTTSFGIRPSAFAVWSAPFLEPFNHARLNTCCGQMQWRSMPKSFKWLG